MEKEKTTPTWIKILLLFLVLENLLLLLLGKYALERLEERFDSMEDTLSQTQNIVGEGITSVSQEMEYALSQQASLVSDFYYTLQPAPRGKILLTLSAQLKSYSAGSAASFSVTLDNGETSLVKTTLSNNTLTATVTLPICEQISVGLVITDNQTTLAQSLSEISHVSDCLTDHLFLTPDLQIKQQGSDIFLSGSISLINEYGSLEEQQLDMVRLEITQGETQLHTFYFSQDYENALPDGQDHHILIFERIRTNPRSGEPVKFSVRARDKGNFEYFCTFAEMSIDANGVASEPVNLNNDFQLVE